MPVKESKHVFPEEFESISDGLPHGVHLVVIRRYMYGSFPLVPFPQGVGGIASVEESEVFHGDEEHSIDYGTEGADVGTIPVGVPPLFPQGQNSKRVGRTDS